MYSAEAALAPGKELLPAGNEHNTLPPRKETWLNQGREEIESDKSDERDPEALS